jgi:DNA primase catalytic core
MSSQITDFIKYELYPNLYDSIDRVLPEFDFKRKGKNWISSNKRKITGEEGDSIGKVYVWERSPGSIKDFTRETSSIVDYVMRRDRVEFIEAVKTLAEVVGLQLPKGEFNQEVYQRYKDKTSLLENCSSYFTFCLENSKGAEDVKTYLNLRGYSNEDVKAMELGYIPDQESLNRYLLNKGFTQSLIDELLPIKKDTRIGSTHKLVIPYRSGVDVRGFKFRTVGEDTPKYVNTAIEGMRTGAFFNLSGIKGDKDVVIVEGELDSLSATVRGVENVVATGGSSINSDQVRDAIKRGAKKFTLCLDTEPGKEETTNKNIDRAVEVILGEGVNRVYIVTLPDLGESKTDPDRLIKESGVEAFKEAISGALPYYEYRLQELLKRFNLLEQERGYLTPKELDSLLDEVVGIATNIPEPIDRDVFKKLFTSLPAIKELGITQESLDITVERLTSTKDKEAQAVALRELLSEAKDYQDKGEVEESINLLEDKIKEVRLQDKRANYSSLLLPTTEAQIKDEEKGLPGSLKTGYTISGEELLLPGGAITVYAGATGHGKTVMAINTVLNVASAYPDKKFVFFTYEERASAILQYFLNTYVDIALNSAQSANRRVLQEYFKTGSTQYLSGEVLDYFQSKKDEFFKTYIETGRILVKYVSLNSEELTSAIRYIHKEEPNIAGVFIDYFQLLNLPGGVKRAERINSRQEELKRICIALKDVAVDTGLPLCLTAQFNREVYNLLDIHPTKIREAADIEQVVNTLVGIWNLGKKDVAKETTKGNENEITQRTGGAQSGMYVELLKSRDLSTGIYEVLEFNGNTGKVKNSSIKKELH